MKQKNKLGMGFLISSFINMVLALLVAFGIYKLSQTILIVLALITLINAVYLLYKACYIFSEERT